MFISDHAVKFRGYRPKDLGNKSKMFISPALMYSTTTP